MVRHVLYDVRFAHSLENGVVLTFSMMVFDDGSTLVAYCDLHADTQFTLQSDGGHRADVRGMLRLFEDHIISQHMFNTQDCDRNPT